METPVYDFVQAYLKKNSVRLHMPGHKGHPFLGCEPLDITEIAGADVLSESGGILGESQRNASSLFGTGETFYSTEGSSLCIKSMLAAALMAGKPECPGSRPWVLAARNVHRSMIDGCALLDLDVEFIPSGCTKSICSTNVDAGAVDKILSGCETGVVSQQKKPSSQELPLGQSGVFCQQLPFRAELPIGVYLTSPDYLGAQSDIASVSKVCHRYGIPLLVDNAHGAYLAFLEESQHPIALGADICCDSAHKTLPVLTGGAYLHLAHSCAGKYRDYVSKALALFGSTSPSYLILQSLDWCNRYLSEGYPRRLEECVQTIIQMKTALSERGIAVQETEPLKIVIDTAVSGYNGQEIAEELRDFSLDRFDCPANGSHGNVQGIECEYADNRFLVFMLTPENSRRDFECLWKWVEATKLNKKKQGFLLENFSSTEPGIRRMSIRQAVLSPWEMIPARQAVGRILAQETVSCPPAVPIGISGEEVTAEMAELFQAYGIQEIAVVACNV